MKTNNKLINKKVFTFLSVLTLAFLSYVSSQAESSEYSLDGYSLYWAEEFNEGEITKLDGDTWDYETGFVRGEEEQFYLTPEQQAGANIITDLINSISSSWGMLKIIAWKFKYLNPNYVEGAANYRFSRRYAKYVSSSVISKPDSIQFGAGLYVVSAKLPLTGGFWPALWFTGLKNHYSNTPDNHYSTWPQYGEIDLIEGTNKPGYLENGFSAHFLRDGHYHLSTHSLPVVPPREYHEYVMEWDEQYMKFYLDGKLEHTVDLEATKSTNGDSPFINKFFNMRINLAVKDGGHAGPLDTSVDSDVFEIDYIRYYKKDSQ